MSLSILNEELERFYSEKFYFSYSSINKLLFSPRVFYNHYILKQKEDSTETKIRVLKNRFSGETGLATSLFYNADSGRYTESEDVFKDKAITNNGNDPF